MHLSPIRFLKNTADGLSRLFRNGGGPRFIAPQRRKTRLSGALHVGGNEMNKEDFRKLCLPLIMDSVDACGAVIKQVEDEVKSGGNVRNLFLEISTSVEKAANLLQNINKTHRWFVSQIGPEERAEIIDKLTKHINYGEKLLKSTRFEDESDQADAEVSVSEAYDSLAAILFLFGDIPGMVKATERISSPKVARDALARQAVMITEAILKDMTSTKATTAQAQPSAR